MGQRADEMRRHDQDMGHTGEAGLEEMRAELEQTRTEASETIDAIQERLTPEHLAGEAVGQARQQAKAQAASQKERAADSLGSVAQALRQSSQQLREQDRGTLAQYTEKAADQVERFSGSLRNKDVNQLLSEAENFARRQPGVFLGGAFAVGLLAARFLKSSSQQAQAGAGRTPPPAEGAAYGTAQVWRRRNATE
jgi:hypothetical protein